jgi:tetratricopeptide (TPR) repeat protein
LTDARRERIETLIAETEDELTTETRPVVRRQLQDDLDQLQRDLQELGDDRPTAVEAGTTNFVHPYPLQQHFTGRVRERRMLTDWLTSGEQPVFAMIGMGGQGKSALTWVWANRDVMGRPLPGLSPQPDLAVDEARRPECVLWWSFYERDASFDAFLDEAIRYFSDGVVDPARIRSPHDKIRGVAQLLERRRCLIVLDGFERELRAYGGMGAAYQGDADAASAADDYRVCTNIHAEDFLRQVSALTCGSRVLITSRLHPTALDDLAGCRREDLDSLSPQDAVAFFRTHDIQGIRTDIEAACEPYGYHPLALRLLAGVVAQDRRSPGDIRVADRRSIIDRVRGKEKHHILEVAYDALDKKKARLLSRIAAFRHPMAYEALAILNEYRSDEPFDAALTELEGRGLLFCDPQHGRYDLHPIVRQSAYDRLGAPGQVHEQLRDYFADVPEPDSFRSVEDLSPVIELYHHTARAGRYDDAWTLYRDRIGHPLYWYLGRPDVCAELLGALFPAGGDPVPALSDAGSRGEAMNRMGNALSQTGGLREAARLSEALADMDRSLHNDRSLMVTLHNLGRRLGVLGELASAEKTLLEGTERAAARMHSFQEGVGHQHLGLVYAAMGRPGPAERALAAADAAFSGEENLQGRCVVAAHRAASALLTGNPEAARTAAKTSRDLASEVARTSHGLPRDFMKTEWLLGWSHTELAAGDENLQEESLRQAETHLTAALTLCRENSMVDHEPDILLAWARWHRASGGPGDARRHAQEALLIADRCELRLAQADIHNFLAQLALDEGDTDTARAEAEIGKERAWCDGPTHSYKPAVDEAERLLAECDAD